MEQKDFVKTLNNNSTIIVLDTNVILDLFRFSLHTSLNLLEILEACIEKIWIPNQVYREYTKNKFKVFGDSKKRYINFEKNLKNIIIKTESDINKLLKNSHRYNYFGIENFENELTDSFSNLKTKVEEYKNNIGIEYNKIQVEKNEFLECIDEFIEIQASNGRVGKSLALKEKLEILSEGELRYRYKIPPGFEDDRKEGIEKFGDLFVWKEIINLPQNNTLENVIFITSDEKNDWWDKNKSGILEIKKELLEEFLELNPDKNINFITLSEFQKYASEIFDLYDIDTFIELNKFDELYIERISENIVDDIIDDLNKNYFSYLDGLDLGSEGIDNVEIESCDFYKISDVYLNSNENEAFISYSLDFEVTISCDSYEYWGRDSDTKEVILSPPSKHKINGIVNIDVIRVIEKDSILSDPSYLKNDENFINFKINGVSFDVVETEDYYDEDNFDDFTIDDIEERGFTCPKCGKIFKDHSKDIGGICSDCCFE